MDFEAALYSSTLKDLAPNQVHEVRFRRSKSSGRYLGSFVLNLRRPSRSPVFSRKYTPGDPIRLIDWRAFARTDQLIVREQREEASPTITVCLDVSPSMQWPDSETAKIVNRPAPQKQEVAWRISLNLCFMHMKMGDRVRLVLFRQNAPFKVLTLRTVADVLTLFHLLESQLFGVDEKELNAVEINEIGRADILYVVTDGISQSSWEWCFSSNKHVLFLHLLSHLEKSSEWLEKDHCYFDENDNAKEYLGDTLLTNEQYERKLSKWLERLQKDIRHKGGSYFFLTDKTPIQHFHAGIMGYATSSLKG